MVTLTENVHIAVRFIASVAVHDTFVEPTVNCELDAGAQTTVTGAAPPDTVGASYRTVAGAPSVDCVSRLAGQTTDGGAGGPGGGGGGGVGWFGDPPHIAAAVQKMTSAKRCRIARRAGRVSVIHRAAAGMVGAS